MNPLPRTAPAACPPVSPRSAPAGPARPWAATALVLALTVAVALVAALLVAAGPGPARAATVLDVAGARAAQGSGTATVRGYVVGQPTGSDTVVRSGFPSDYALALADTAGETDTGAMIYVQVPSAFRSSWGLRSNPGLMGRRIDVTGTLAAYFSRPGVTGATAFASAPTSTGSGSPTPSPTPSPTATSQPSGSSGPRDGYYDRAQGKTGTALASALHTIISSGTTALSYDAVWAALRVTDRDPARSDRVIGLYSGFSMPASDNGGGVDQWNREHVWAKSHGDFGTATGPGTDLHHLRPEDVTVNGARGNLDFDAGGTVNSEAPGNRADGDSWEPRDAVKGDVARMIFYMAVRYDGGDGWPDLVVDDAVGGGTAPRHGRLSVLLAWNEQDPPDAFERNRNDVIDSRYQHNRNPFIDRPEWADAIW